MEKVSKKGGISTKKRKAPVLVPSEDILFHKETHKYRVKPAIRPKSQEEVFKIAASKRAEAEAIGRVATTVAGEERQILPHLPTINPIFPPAMENIGQEGDPGSSCKRKGKGKVGSVPWKDMKVAAHPKSFEYVNNCLAGRRFTFDELGEPLAENESDCDRMLKLSSYVMAEYNDRLREAERNKAKLKENKQLVDDARRSKGLLTRALQLKDETMESLKRRNGENVRLKKLFEATKQQLEMATLETSKVREELDGALIEISELKKSILPEREAAVQEYLGSQAFQHAIKPYCIQEGHFEKRKWMAVLERYDDGSVLQKYREDIDKCRRKGENFVLAVDPNSEEDSDDEVSADEQTRQVDNDHGGAEDGGRAQSDIVRGSTSDEGDQ